MASGVYPGAIRLVEGRRLSSVLARRRVSACRRPGAVAISSVPAGVLDARRTIARPTWPAWTARPVSLVSMPDPVVVDLERRACRRRPSPRHRSRLGAACLTALTTELLGDPAGPMLSTSRGRHDRLSIVERDRSSGRERRHRGAQRRLEARARGPSRGGTAEMIARVSAIAASISRGVLAPPRPCPAASPRVAASARRGATRPGVRARGPRRRGPRRGGGCGHDASRATSAARWSETCRSAIRSSRLAQGVSHCVGERDRDHEHDQQARGRRKPDLPPHEHGGRGEQRRSPTPGEAQAARSRGRCAGASVPRAGCVAHERQVHAHQEEIHGQHEHRICRVVAAEPVRGLKAS